MLHFSDQLRRSIVLPQFPGRIISLVPSQTELLYDLGLEEQVVGITKFCVHPESWFRTKTRVGGTKTVNIEKALSLRPDLIIANKEENIKEQIDALASGIPVWVSDVNTLDEACDMIAGIGAITNTVAAATVLTGKIREGFKRLSSTVQRPAISLPAAYLIWKDPYMTAGGDTFIHDMLTRCGFRNVFAGKDRYPSVVLQELKEAGCRLVLLSSEPYPFKEKHIAGIQATLPETRVLLVDGEMFSWYGSRLVKAADYLEKICLSLR
ncbi:MAG TPA: helical backbone metal receptor [Chitinophagaceae bacterium]|nr:helical backbone metal receptor [Chitinophagaceae bacterium]